MAPPSMARRCGALLLAALLLAPALGQTYASVDECALDYVQKYNITEADAKAKCFGLFPHPGPSLAPLRPPIPALPPPPTFPKFITTANPSLFSLLSPLFTEIKPPSWKK